MKKAVESISCTVDIELAEKFKQKAKSLGVTPAALLRNILTSDLRKTESMLSMRDLQNSILALIPALVDFIGRTQKASKEQIENLTVIALKKWETSFLEDPLKGKK